MAKKKEAAEEKNELTKGAKDDWESIKLILEGMPSLKQRVLHKIREFKNRGKEEKKVSAKEARDYKRNQQKKNL